VPRSMSGAIHPLPQYAFMAWCLVKALHFVPTVHSNFAENLEFLLTYSSLFESFVYSEIASYYKMRVLIFSVLLLRKDAVMCYYFHGITFHLFKSHEHLTRTVERWRCTFF